jgi:hypothetical protein
MTWIQVLTVILANVGLCFTLFLWVRKEANADRKELSSSISSGITEARKEMVEFRKMWAQETKEFHGRLCSIEEKYKTIKTSK